MNHFFRIASAFLLLFVLSAGNHACAQSDSPYSRFGLGILSGNTSIYQSGMGNTGISNSNPYHISMKNPALLPVNKFSSFEAALDLEYKQLKTEKVVQKNRGGNLSYAAFAFPVSRKVSIGFGMNPYSRVNYTDSDEEKLPNSPTFVRYRYKGSGGVTQVYFGGGAQLTSSFAAGLQIAYNFGALRTEWRSQLVDTDRGLYINELLTRTNFNHFSFRPGFVYSIKTGKKSRLNIGLTGDLGVSSDARQFKAENRMTYSEIVLLSDTVSYDTQVDIFIPPSYEFGISYGIPMKITVALDVKMQDWSSYKGPSAGTAGESTQVNFGLEWVPDAGSVSSYLKRASYRIGASYNKMPVILKNKQAEEYALHFGATLPLSQSVSALNFAIIAGKRGTASDGLIEESFIRLRFGATINESWFTKRKIF